jgi:hypothetical protein
MGVFVRLIPDSKVIKASEDFSSVAIAGCSGCANISMAYAKDQPISRITIDETTGKPKRLPYALLEQIGHLKKLLQEKGVKVTTETIRGMCMDTDDSEYAKLLEDPSWTDSLKERCANVEAFITLCCSGGVFCLKQQLGKDIKIIPGMRDAGTWQVLSVLDEKKEFVLIDRDKSTVIQWK